MRPLKSTDVETSPICGAVLSWPREKTKRYFKMTLTRSNTCGISPMKKLATGALVALCSLALLAPSAMAAEPEGQHTLGTVEASRDGVKRTRTRTRTKRRVRKSRRSRSSSQRSGAYFVGGVGMVNLTDQPSNLDLDDGAGISLGLGYRLMPQLALEGTFHGSLHDSVGGTDATSSNSLTGGSLNLKYFIPLSGPRLEAYGQAGLGFMNVSSGDTEIEGTFFDIGAGLDYRLSREAAAGVKANFSSLSGEDQGGGSADLNTFSLMATISFQL